MNCFKYKGEFEVCPHCGYVEGTVPEQAYDLLPGTVLENRYIIGTCIGFGGFGITYRAYDTVLNIMVAIKEFYPAGLVNRSPGDTKVGIFSGEKEKEFERQLERFLDEARNMAIFSKERDIVNVYHFFQANGTAYTIMEYIDGILLKQHLKEKGKMSVEEAVSYMVPILEALEKIHRQGIVHKDISPDNIFLTGKGSVKIFDFGAARFPKGQRDKTFSVIIKAGYAPPEQYRSSCEPGPFMDIYAAGAVFYEMITGIRPGEGSDRQIEDDLELPSKLGVDIDKNLEKIIMKALSVKPELRFQTAADFKECIVQNREVLLPQEELRKRMHKRALRIGSVSVGGAIAAVGIMAAILFSMGKDKLNMNRIKKDTLSVWLATADNGTEKNDVAKMLQDDFKQNCPNITLDIKEIPENIYAGELQKACKAGTLPDVFCTDYLQGDITDYCGSQKKLFHTIDMEAYPYFDQLDSDGGMYYKVPIGIQMAALYENYGKYQEAGKQTGSSVTLEDIKKIPREQRAIEDEYENFGDPESAVNAIAGDLSCFERVSEATVRAIPSQEISIAPVVDEEGKLQAVFCDCYGINKNSSTNRQEAGMVCISFLLHQSIQEECYLRNYQALPVQKEALKQYEEIKLTGYLEFITDYLDHMRINDECSSVAEVYFYEL